MIDTHGKDDGTITLFVIVIFVALLASAGLVVDGGAKLRAAREASAVAEESARAGAGRVDVNRAYAYGGRFLVGCTAAVTAAQAYLTSTGHAGTVTITKSREIRVTVTISKPTTLLALIGITDVHATKSPMRFSSPASIDRTQCSR